MVEMVDARRSAESKEERHDLFSGLLDAAQDDPDGSVAITEEELIGNYQLSCCIAAMKKISLAIPGNMFIFLLAGHEVSHPISPVIHFESYICCRRQPTHFASRLPYLPYTPTSKSGYISK